MLLTMLFLSIATANPNQVGQSYLNFALPALNKTVAVEQVGSPEVMLSRYVGPVPQVDTAAVVLFFFTQEMGVELIDPFRQLQKEFSKKSVYFIGVCSDTSTDLTTWAKESGANFPILHDRFLLVADRYEVPKYPRIFLLDRKGKVFAQSSPVLSRIKKDLRAELQHMLEEDKRLKR